MSSPTPFTPGVGSTANLVLSATSTTSSAALPSAQGSVRIVNAGTANIAFRFGTTTATAVFATDTVMLAGTVEVFTKGIGQDTIAVITASSTSTVYVSVGEGV